MSQSLRGDIECIRIEYNQDRCYALYGVLLQYFDEVIAALVNDTSIRDIRIVRFFRDGERK